MNKEYILSLSYGKDSIACIEVIKQLDLPLDRIIHAEIWATETIPADLPPMVEFKVKADRIIKERYGITVEHISAGITYEDVFYRVVERKREVDSRIYGFPSIRCPWCNSVLKVSALNKINKNAVAYVGIASDEPKRLARLDGVHKISPLYLAKWTEKMCYDWCKENDLLSPIYTTSSRGGCWFCHNQSVEQLRQLRKNYPEYWALLLKWDNDSPITFKPNRTLHDFEKRFNLEDKKILKPDAPFRWDYLDGNIQLSLF